MSITHLVLRKDKTGVRYGRLVVLGRATRSRYWTCRCDCGHIKDIAGSSLVRGMTQSCGCLRLELLSQRASIRMTKHGLHTHRIYGIYQGVMQRCENPNNASYRLYGGRGIRCLFTDFAHFFKWSQESGYAPDLSIDRIDNDGDYSPSNCRWADSKTQLRNFRRNRILTVNGISRCIAEWAELMGMSPRTLNKRLRSGWSADQALMTPVNKALSRTGHRARSTT